MSSISYGLAGSTRVGNLASRLMVGSAETGMAPKQALGEVGVARTFHDPGPASPALVAEGEFPAAKLPFVGVRRAVEAAGADARVDG